jgi:hypothetical protein
LPKAVVVSGVVSGYSHARKPPLARRVPRGNAGARDRLALGGGSGTTRRPRSRTGRWCASGCCGLDDVNEVIEQVLDGSAPPPRMVFDMQATRTEGSHDGRATAGVQS